MCVSGDGGANLEACRARALRQISDLEEESPFLLVGRGEFNFCQTTSLPHSSQGGGGGREDSVITQIVLTAAILTIKFTALRLPGETEQSYCKGCNFKKIK